MRAPAGVVFTNEGLPGVSEMEDALLAYTGCLRDHGVDLPDPDFSDGGAMLELMIDPGDEAFREADDACREILARSGPVGG